MIGLGDRTEVRDKDPFFEEALPASVVAQIRATTEPKPLAPSCGPPSPNAARREAILTHNLRQMVAAGARLVLGTDTGIHPGHTFGTGDHHELARWVQLGIPPAEAIVAATSRPAALLGIADMGRLRRKERRLRRARREPARRHPQHAADRAGRPARTAPRLVTHCARSSSEEPPRNDGAHARSLAAAATAMATTTAMAAMAVMTAAIALAQSGRMHELKLVPGNVHWVYYDAAVKPVLRIASGDSVRVEAMLARGLPRLYAAGVKDDEIPEALKVIERSVTERGAGAHPLTGPIFVEGAEPGDTLEVKIVAFEYLHPYGVSGFIPGSGTLPDDFPYATFRLVRFDRGPAPRRSLRA